MTPFASTGCCSRRWGARETRPTRWRESPPPRKNLLAQLPQDKRDAASRQIDESTARLLGPWMRFLLKYDPRITLRQIRIPVLALNGSLDTQVPAKQDLERIDGALKAAGNRDYRIVEFPGLNHLFQNAKTGLASEYGAIEEMMSPSVLELVASWINQRFEKH
jgi:fermentation-respiration switch protein FrsA (DUF1100 family)